MIKRTTAKTGLKLGKRKASRTPAGTVVLYGKALVGNDQARTELRDALDSARTAYRRSSDRRGRLDIGALLEDRKARREAGNAVASLRRALRTAGRKREQPKSAKGPAVVVLAVAATGGAVAFLRHRQARALETNPTVPTTAGHDGEKNV